MNCDYRQLTHPAIKTLNPYVPGKSIEEVVREFGITDIIKLASNENVLGCSPKVTELLSSIPGSLVATYPSAVIHPLRKKLADKLHVEEGMITLGNGSDTLFSVLLTLFALHSSKHVLTHDTAFLSFPIQAQTLGIPLKSMPVKENWVVDVEALIKACTEETALLFIANPNNPTGLFIPLEQIEMLLMQVPSSTIVVIDEAYADYAFSKNDPGALRFIEKYENLVVTRTFSKIYGLAGLRLGYAIANVSISQLMQRIQLPFVANQLALAAGFVALDDEDFYDKTIENNREGLQQMQQGLKSLGLSFIPSHGNFITFDCQGDGALIYQHLLQQGVIVRPLHPYSMPNYLRVTIGKPAQNERVLGILRLIYKSTGGF